MRITLIALFVFLLVATVLMIEVGPALAFYLRSRARLANMQMDAIDGGQTRQGADPAPCGCGKGGEDDAV